VQRGIATNLLNPKALLFFMGLLAAMVTPQVDGLTRGLLVLELFLLSLVWFACWPGASPPCAQRLLGRISVRSTWSPACCLARSASPS
jgi:threonine/homoserine/homoserine lactone efflux protein